MLNTKEAGDKIGVEPQTIRRYVTIGLGVDYEKLKAIEVMHGRRKEYRISLSDLEYYKKKYLTVKEVIKP